MQSRPFAIIGDELQPNKMLMCAMREAEGAEVVSLYQVEEVVQVSGQYMGNLPIAGNPTMPILADCTVAGPTDKVVRPAQASETTPPL
jgi:hypothetical protein